MRLILCCDYGLDDALATVDVLSHMKEDNYTVDIVAVGGNVPAARALANAHTLVSAIGIFPNFIVDTTALAQPECFLTEIHGADGMGSLFERTLSPVPVVAFRSYLEYLDLMGEEYDLLSLGPMTVIPELLAHGKCRRFVFMGGNLKETPNYHGYEFNHGLNRRAFSAAVKREHVAVTMDTCRHPLFNIQMKELEGGGLFRKIANRIKELNWETGEVGCYVWDDIAVKYLRHPDWFELYEGEDRDKNKLTVARYIRKAAYPDIIEE